MATDPIIERIRKGWFLRRRGAGLVARDHTDVEWDVAHARKQMFGSLRGTFTRDPQKGTLRVEPRPGGVDGVA